MPIDSVKHSIHIRRKKNALVFHNIDRLRELGRSALTHQDILDGLHPWKENKTLKFENKLPVLLGIIGIIFTLAIFISPSNISFQITSFLGCLMVFWAYITYENDDPIEDVISYLEKETISKKYQLAFNKQPAYLNNQLNSMLFIAKLKRLFPVFNQGTVKNNIQEYASTTWLDDNGKEHEVLTFMYRYTTEIKYKDKDGYTVRIKEIEKSLWGVFIFDVGIQGIAITSSNKIFDPPYTYSWHSSDIETNQKIKIFGCNELHMAKLVTPVLTLKLAQFFQHQYGDLLFHPEEKIMCFLGPKNLFQNSEQKKNIEDISSLRGHLRTFKLPYLEKLQHDLVHFLK